jgi:hypothetical protein
VKKRKRKKFVSQNQTEAEREHAGPFLNTQIQILSEGGQNKFGRFRNLHFPEYKG